MMMLDGEQKDGGKSILLGQSLDKLQDVGISASGLDLFLRDLFHRFSCAK
jgi:hypothetical protein